jgi:hypothetical protein
MNKHERSPRFYVVGAVSVVLGAALLSPAGCSDDGSKCAAGQSECTGGASGSGGSAGSGGTAGTGGSGGTAGSDAGSGEPCGGIASLQCSAPETMYCDFPESMTCGASDGTGICTPRPESCVAGGPGVCGCDGKPYTNACEAHRAGTDDHPTGTCSTP